MKGARDRDETLFFILPAIAKVNDFTILANRWASDRCTRRAHSFQQHMALGEEPIIQSLGRIFYAFELNQTAVSEFKRFLTSISSYRGLERAAMHVEGVLACYTCFFGVECIGDLPALMAEGLAILGSSRQILSEICPAFATTSIGAAALRDEVVLREFVRRILTRYHPGIPPDLIPPTFH